MVPLGHGPDGYYAVIVTDRPLEFHSEQEANEWRMEWVKRQIKKKPRSGLEILIDRACGLE